MGYDDLSEEDKKLANSLLEEYKLREKWGVKHPTKFQEILDKYNWDKDVDFSTTNDFRGAPKKLAAEYMNSAIDVGELMLGSLSKHRTSIMEEMSEDKDKLHDMELHVESLKEKVFSRKFKNDNSMHGLSSDPLSATLPREVREVQGERLFKKKEYDLAKIFDVILHNKIVDMVATYQLDEENVKNGELIARRFGSDDWKNGTAYIAELAEIFEKEDGISKEDFYDVIRDKFIEIKNRIMSADKENKPQMPDKEG